MLQQGATARAPVVQLGAVGAQCKHVVVGNRGDHEVDHALVARLVRVELALARGRHELERDVTHRGIRRVRHDRRQQHISASVISLNIVVLARFEMMAEHARLFGILGSGLFAATPARAIAIVPRRMQILRDATMEPTT